MIKLLGIYDYTVILTYLSLVSAVIGILQGCMGKFGAAILCLMASGLCDAFDGAVARTKKDRTEDGKNFGIQLDSLCDVVSFGLAPALLCYHMGMGGWLGIAILILFCVCGVIRLAWFNVLEAKRQQVESGCGKVYHGLPITASSILLPPVYCLRFVLTENVFVAILHIVMALMGFLFVLDFQVPKLDFGKLLVKK